MSGTLLKTIQVRTLPKHIQIMQHRQSGDVATFKKTLNVAKNIVVLTGAGISAESGIPTFRGAGGFWRKYQSSSLATPEAFYSTPSLVWEFYHYRRECAAKAQPNAAHLAIADLEKKCASLGKSFTVVTQNVDGLHVRAGTRNIVELHGNLYKTRCTKCEEVKINNDSPICEALANCGGPEVDVVGSDIPKNLLPHCEKNGCGALLRPHIVWFGENLDSAVLSKAQSAVEACDVCLVVGTSSVVYPAAMFAPSAAERGATVAEFNTEPTSATSHFHYYFEGPCGLTIPNALAD